MNEDMAMEDVNTLEISDQNTPFSSLSVFRAEHGKLIKKSRVSGELELGTFEAAVGGFIARGRATGALLDDEDDRWTAQSLLDYWGATLYRPGNPALDTTLVPFTPTLAPTLPDDDCPYRGLEPFHEEHARLFFGREWFVEGLVEHLKTNRLLAIVGASGSGTSSLVQAGLIPTLKTGALPESAQWHYLPVLRPGTMPLTRLLKLLNTSAADANGHAVGRRSLLPTVLVIDQFEEIFTLCTDETQRQKFVTILHNLVRSSAARYYVILTLRRDFERYLQQVPAFQELFKTAKIYLPPPDVTELRTAIEEPAERVGLKFEADLVDALLHDIQRESISLPLLQFTLLQLWQERQGNRITWEAYRRGGVSRQALERSANTFYHNLSADEQGTARRILLRLVRVGENDQVVSQRVSLDVVYRSDSDTKRVKRVLDGLNHARLIRQTEGDTPAEIQVEIIHEALAYNWPLLFGWLQEEREHLRQRQRLAVAADQWLRLGRDNDALWRGALLAEALRYDDLTAFEHEFVSASQAVAHAAETSPSDGPQPPETSSTAGPSMGSAPKWPGGMLALAVMVLSRIATSLRLGSYMMILVFLVPFAAIGGRTVLAQFSNETRSVPVQVAIEGMPLPGFATGRLDWNAQSVQISGAAYRVEQVNIAQGVVELPQSSTSFEKSISLQAHDSAGQLVEGVVIEPATVNVHVPIRPLQLKRLPVVADITGVTAPGYIIAGIRTDPAFVNVRSNNGSDAIADIAQIETAPVDVTNATSNITREVELLISEGTALQSGEPLQVNVTVQIEALNPIFQVQLPVELTGVDNGLAYQVNPVLATLEGTAEEFMSLDPDPIVAKVDVSERGAGNYQLIPTIEGLPPAIRVVAVDSAAVVLIAAASPTHTRTVTPSPSAWPTITLTSTPSSTPASTLTTTPTVVTSTPTATPTSTLTVTLTPSTTLTITPTIATTETITTTPPTTPDPTQSETTSTTPAGNAETATPDESPSTPTMPSSTTEVPSETPTPISLTEPTQEALPPSPTTESDNLEESSTD